MREIDQLLCLVRDLGYQRAHNKPFRLSSGKLSWDYFDAKKVLLTQKGLRAFAIWALSQPVFRTKPSPAGIGGIELGSIAPAIAISVLAPFPLNGFIVRKKPKSHSLKRQIEGVISPNSRVIVVEDVITTGRSSQLAIKAIEDLGASCEAIICLIDRDLDRTQHEDALGDNRRKVVSAFKSSQISPMLRANALQTGPRMTLTSSCSNDAASIATNEEASEARQQNRDMGREMPEIRSMREGQQETESPLP